jgi:hypothetical protein
MAISPIGRIMSTMFASTCVLMAFGSGVAHADPLVGMTYTAASAAVTKWGSTAIVSTVVGDSLVLDDCLVTSSRKTSDIKDNFKHKSGYLLALNCNAKVAGPGTPGNSAASVAGRTEKKNSATAEWINTTSDGAKWCSDNLKDCKNFCDAFGKCSDKISALVS